MTYLAAGAAFAAILAAGTVFAGEFDADNGFGDHSPASQVLTDRIGSQATTGLDMRPTAAIRDDGMGRGEYSATYGFGDHPKRHSTRARQSTLDALPSWVPVR
ncbi:hypothetical protein [Pararhizobium haloflavum]|uniref:hypothetical protein n=1 Tax=Pararhizobium haloflavum TaxID=2037914 RepID=UPI000C17811D|nr:hypothetical protein [Pararhizobium haloflavum]